MNEKTTSRRTPKTSADEMRAEYDFSGVVRGKYYKDFSGVVRGKYYKRYLQSTNVVVLEPDVARRFKNAEAVNEALRSLMRPSTPSRNPTERSPRTRRQAASR